MGPKKTVKEIQGQQQLTALFIKKENKYESESEEGSSAKKSKREEELDKSEGERPPECSGHGSKEQTESVRKKTRTFQNVGLRL